uniref:Uncharacterized protein n=1 Tax=Physcomitrium patens TaxID=3218 RepID=A0A2K1KK66_PHYPA|nr:hypothetical protein PHYPA_007829 [Physcomitrium patens]
MAVSSRKRIEISVGSDTFPDGIPRAIKLRPLIRGNDACSHV